MKTQDLINILKRENISCKIDFIPNNDVIISVLGNINKNVHLQTLTSLPENVHFNNDGNVYLDSLESLQESTQFNNGVYVYLPSLESLPENFQFNNGGSVYLHTPFPFSLCGTFGHIHTEQKTKTGKQPVSTFKPIMDTITYQSIKPRRAEKPPLSRLPQPE